MTSWRWWDQLVGGTSGTSWPWRDQPEVAVTVTSLLWENIVKYRLDFELGLMYQSEHCL